MRLILDGGLKVLKVSGVQNLWRIKLRHGIQQTNAKKFHADQFEQKLL